MSKIKKLVTNIRVIILVIILAAMLITIHPDPYKKGVAIRAVAKNSSAEIAGIHSPLPSDKPMFREVIFDINGQAVNDLSDYYNITSRLKPGDTVIIRTTSNFDYSGDQRKLSLTSLTHKYTLTVLPEYNTTVLNETENVTVHKVVPENVTVNGTVMLENRTINVTETRHKVKKTLVGAQDLGLTVYQAPTSNIKKGLDLQGGTRVLLQPEHPVSDSDFSLIMDNLKQRLNVYGLSDIVVRKVTDLTGNNYILVEVAGANQEEVKNLIASQGKFEAKIRNNTVFRGGQDIKYVCRSADCSYAEDPRQPCSQNSDGKWYCRFQFSITLSPEAAQRQADLTKDLQVITKDSQQYLNESIDLYLDNSLVDSLQIGADLRGTPTTDIAISGSGSGDSYQEAVQDSAQNMKRLQTILITGSLPVALNIVNIDTVSPTLGQEFLRNVLYIGLFALLAVAAVVVLRYRDVKIALPMLFTMGSEIIMLLGLASLIGWNLDLAAIAGILVAVGTGVDDQIVIIDELKQQRKETILNWVERLKRAFFIIMAAYFTTVVAMLPLWWVGAGLVRGFAITTIAGVSFGVFVSRPAFGAIVEILLKD